MVPTCYLPLWYLDTAVLKSTETLLISLRYSKRYFESSNRGNMLSNFIIESRLVKKLNLRSERDTFRCCTLSRHWLEKHDFSAYNISLSQLEVRSGKGLSAMNQSLWDKMLWNMLEFIYLPTRNTSCMQ